MVSKKMLKAEIMEAWQEAQQQLAEVSQAAELLQSENNQLKESITAEQFFGDARWRLLSLERDPRHMTASDVHNIIIRSRLASLLSPLIIAGLKVLKLFVFGQGVTIKANNEEIEAIIRPFLNSRNNRRILMGARARAKRVGELHRDGSLYMRFFSSPSGAVEVRMVEPLEITDIVCNPDDKDTVWFYIRTVNALDPRNGGQPISEVVAYPDIHYSPEDRASAELLLKALMVGVNRVDWDTPVYRITVNEVGKWGLPSYLGALNWAKEYERFLENRATLYAAYAMIATILRERVDRVKQARNQFNQSGKSPVKGAMATMTETGDLTAVNTRNATTPPSEGIQFLEMVVMVFGYPPHMFGREEPGGMGEEGRNQFFKLAITAEREAWKEGYDAILNYVVMKAIENGNNRIGRIVRTSDTTEDIIYDNNVDPTIETSFPPITQSDIQSKVNSVIDATTLKGQPAVGHISPEVFMQLVGPLLGIENLEEIVASLPEQWPLTESEAQSFIQDFTRAIQEAEANVKQ